MNAVKECQKKIPIEYENDLIIMDTPGLSTTLFQ